MTTFGRGNDALLEKRITDGKVMNCNDAPQLSVRPQEKKRFAVDGRVAGATVDDPLQSKKAPGEDQVHLREKLERLYFGRTFKDNIHIQMAYSIMDVEKILTQHINNIVYALNNLLRREDNEFFDLIGNMGMNIPYQSFVDSGNEKSKAFEKLVNSDQLTYFDIKIIEPPKEEIKEGNNDNNKKKAKKSNPGEVKLKKEQFYYLLCLFGATRQALAHGDTNTRAMIYNLNRDNGGEVRQQVGALLDQLYQVRVHELNNGFLEMAQKDLAILFETFNVVGIEQKTRYVQYYYDFIIRKQYKNIGFSIKELREVITEIIEDAKFIKDKTYDSVREKVNRFFDFTVFRYYQDHPAEADEMVGKLRVAIDELDKASVYDKEAKRLWAQVGNGIDAFVKNKMNGTYIKEVKPDPDVSPSMLEGALIPETADRFSKLIYALTLFIDAKEINDLITTLINKFENIAGFADVMTGQMGLDLNLTSNFALFARAEKIAEELRVINNFARMSGKKVDVENVMLAEAMKILGFTGTNEELGAYLDHTVLRLNGKKPEGTRNFIVNNVIKSPRFRYLVRYGNVEKIRFFAQNERVVRFVLKEIPDAQILRYYQSCTGLSPDSGNEMRS